MKTRNNGSLYVHAFVVPRAETPLQTPFTAHRSCVQTSFSIPQATTFKLVGDKVRNLPSVLPTGNVISCHNPIAILDNDNTILDNDITILDNDNTILDNDNTVLDNDDTVLDNDTTVLDNDNTVLDNDNPILDNVNTILTFLYR